MPIVLLYNLVLLSRQQTTLVAYMAFFLKITSTTQHFHNSETLGNIGFRRHAFHLVLITNLNVATSRALLLCK